MVNGMKVSGDDYTYVAGIRFDSRMIVKEEYDNEKKEVTIFLKNGQRVVANFEGKSNLEASRNFDTATSPYIDSFGDDKLYNNLNYDSPERSLYGHNLDGVIIYGVQGAKDNIVIDGKNNSVYVTDYNDNAPADEVKVHNFDIVDISKTKIPERNYVHCDYKDQVTVFRPGVQGNDINCIFRH